MILFCRTNSIISVENKQTSPNIETVMHVLHGHYHCHRHHHHHHHHHHHRCCCCCRRHAVLVILRHHVVVRFIIMVSIDLLPSSLIRSSYWLGHLLCNPSCWLWVIKHFLDKLDVTPAVVNECDKEIWERIGEDLCHHHNMEHCSYIEGLEALQASTEPRPLQLGLLLDTTGSMSSKTLSGHSLHHTLQSNSGLAKGAHRSYPPCFRQKGIMDKGGKHRSRPERVSSLHEKMKCSEE